MARPIIKIDGDENPASGSLAASVFTFILDIPSVYGDAPPDFWDAAPGTLVQYRVLQLQISISRLFLATCDGIRNVLEFLGMPSRAANDSFVGGSVPRLQLDRMLLCLTAAGRRGVR